MKKVLAVDLDDVLLVFNEPLLQFHNRMYGTAHTIADAVTFDLKKVWNCTGEEVFERIHKFYESDDHWNSIPMPGAVDAISVLKEQYEIHIVTAKPDILKEKTHEWLAKYFPNMFDGVHFTNLHYDVHRTKLEVCNDLKACALIDDGPANAVSVSAGGIPVYLINHPWNQEVQGEGITRVFSWEEVVRALLS
jgi:uncharacterized HAD superfamily protein